MKINNILKFTRNYKGFYNERIATWLFNRYIKNKKKYSGITWFEGEAISIYYTSDDYIERRVWMQGEYETEVACVFNSFVSEGNVVLDVGANIGVNSIRLSKLVGSKGRVYSFEPIPFNQERFLKNISLNKVENCDLIKSALGFEKENVNIEVTVDEENMGAISLLKKTESSSGISVDVLNGDEWFLETKLENLDFIKIDVEGFEWNVVHGLQKSILKFHPTIIMEWDRGYQLKSENPISNWENFIKMNSYKIYQVNRFDLQLINSLEEAQNGNVLFI